MLKWFDIPAALTLEQWKAWESATRQEYPIQYYIRRRLPTQLKRIFVWPVERLYWAMMHRYHPKHQYNRIRIPSLEPGYYDPDMRIFHSMFDIVSEYAERLRGDGIEGTRWSQEYLDKQEGWEYASLLQQIDYEAAAVSIADWWKDYLEERKGDPYFLDGGVDREEERRNQVKEKMLEVVDILDTLWYP